MSLLKIRNLNINFETAKGNLQAIKNLSFSLELGSTLGIVGESGCGKSITNLALMGLLPDNANVSFEQFLFEGHNLGNLKESQWRQLRGSDIAMIFQDPMTALNPSFTVGTQIMETLKIHHRHLNKSGRQKKALELLDQVGIPAAKERMNSYAHELSGGMSQRVMIAIAIACDPKLLIADEPTTALDVTIQDQILKLLKDIQKEKNMSMIFVTHDLGVVAEISDQIQVMYAGEVVERGSTIDIINSPSHPYTQGLLHSLPGQNKRGFRSKLPSIAGMVPDLIKRPSGCQFSPRCEKAQEDCFKASPKLRVIKNREVRCPYDFEALS